MTSILSTLIAQFTGLAPRTLLYRGMEYQLRISKASPVLVNETTHLAIFSYRGRLPGLILDSTIAVGVRYDEASDLYNIHIGHFDALTFESTNVADVGGVYVEDFERLADFVRVPAAK